jgi:hypothetical protein
VFRFDVFESELIRAVRCVLVSSPLFHGDLLFALSTSCPDFDIAEGIYSLPKYLSGVVLLHCWHISFAAEIWCLGVVLLFAGSRFGESARINTTNTAATKLIANTTLGMGSKFGKRWVSWF